MYFSTYESTGFYKSNSYRFDTGIYGDSKQNIDLLVGDSEFDRNNYKKLSLSNFDDAFNQLLSTDISNNEELLSFVNMYGLPCSDAYTSLLPCEVFYFEEFYTRDFCDEASIALLKKETLRLKPYDFLDICPVSQVKNSLLTLKDLAALREILDSKNKSPETSFSILHTLSKLLLHFNHTDLFNTLESGDLSTKTDTGRLIQNIFKPYRDDFPLFYSSMLEDMLRADYSDPVFNSFYNTAKCSNIFRIIKTLYDILMDDKINPDQDEDQDQDQDQDDLITLKKFIEMSEPDFSQFKTTVNKHLNLNKIKNSDLHDTANFIFEDLLLEALATCTPSYRREGDSIKYTLKIFTPLQALYLHLYKYNGNFNYCRYCGAMFEITNNRNKIYCSETCSHRARSKRYYDKNK